MPEGHTLHRLARDLTSAFAGQRVRSSSPQGRFEAGAARVDSLVVSGARAHGKHLFMAFEELEDQVHVHLGLFGKWSVGRGGPVRGAVRWRLEGETKVADLRGPTACELLTPDEVEAIDARLGPDPLVKGTGADAAWPRVSRSRSSIATLLMNQEAVAGIGNVYRAEILFRHGIDPDLPARELTWEQWSALWDDLVTLMEAGVRTRRIETLRPEDRPPGRPRGRRSRGYVYKRTDEPCLICDTPIATKVVGARNLFWCPTCQSAATLGR